MKIGTYNYSLDAVRSPATGTWTLVRQLADHDAAFVAGTSFVWRCSG
jgi:hypothetical protein